MYISEDIVNREAIKAQEVFKRQQNEYDWNRLMNLLAHYNGDKNFNKIHGIPDFEEYAVNKLSQLNKEYREIQLLKVEKEK